MLFLKIGKDKHKFKLKLSFNKLVLPQKWQKIVKQVTKSSVVDNKGQKFYRVKFIRGSSHLQIEDSIRVKKNVVKFGKKEHVIPMTLFYDEDEKQYLQKQAEVKLYQVDQFDRQQKIAESKLNLGEYANKGKLMMEFELDYEQKYDKYVKKLSKENPDEQIPGPVMVIQFFMQRQDDDSKSVQTFSSDQIKFNFNSKGKNSKGKGQQQSEERRSRQNKQKRTKTQQSQLQFPSSKNRLKQKNTGSDDQIVSNLKKNPNRQKQQRQRSSKNKTVQPAFKNGKNQKTEDTIRKNQKSEKRSVIQFGQTQNSKKDGDKFDSVNKRFRKQENSPGYQNFVVQQQEQHQKDAEAGSPQFQLYILKKQLEQKEKQLRSGKTQIESFKKIVNKLNEQKFQQQRKRVMNEDQSKFGKKQRIQQQIQSYKKSLVDRDLKISGYEYQLKEIKQRETAHQRTILKQNKQIDQLKQKLQKTKYSIAYLMQKGFESGDKQLINFIHQNLQLDQQ